MAIDAGNDVTMPGPRPGRRHSSRVRRATILVLMLALVVAALLIPLPYVALSPGPVFNALGNGPSGQPLIQVDGSATYPSAGRLDITMVGMRGGPGPRMTVLNYLRSWLSGDTDIYPESRFLADDGRYRRDREQSLRAMQETERRATALALARVHLDPTVVDVRMHIEDVGGTSAGLMLTLGLVDKLTVTDLTGGAHVAGTGSLDERGNVLAIGGIRQKMIAAKRAGASVFLAPAANCAEAMQHRSPGVRVVRVTSVDDALAALAQLRAGRPLPSC